MKQLLQSITVVGCGHEEECCGALRDLRGRPRRAGPLLHRPVRLGHPAGAGHGALPARQDGRHRRQGHADGRRRHQRRDPETACGISRQRVGQLRQRRVARRVGRAGAAARRDRHETPRARPGDGMVRHADRSAGQPFRALAGGSGRHIARPASRARLADSRDVRASQTSASVRLYRRSTIMFILTLFTLVRALVYATLFIGFGLVFLPSRLLAATGTVRPAVIGLWQAGGILVGAAGAALVLSCILCFVFVGHGTQAPFDPPRRLVVRGPYGLVRNPMYLGAAAAMLGAAFFYQSFALAVYVVAFFAVTHLFVVAYEEPTLSRTFGPEYEAYRRSVRRWGMA